MSNQPQPGPRYEEVDHPAHYAGAARCPGCGRPIECIDVIEVLPTNLAMAVKYLWRAGEKPGTATDTDLRKAAWYVERQRELIARKELSDVGRQIRTTRPSRPLGGGL